MPAVTDGSVWRRVGVRYREMHWCASCGRFSADGYLCERGAEQGTYYCRRHMNQFLLPDPPETGQQELFSAAENEKTL